MKISYYSDLHLEFDYHKWDHIFNDGADVMVLAGDIGVKNRQVEWILAQPHKHIIYVPGNHEYYQSSIEGVNRKLDNAFRGTNVHFLPEGEHVIIDGVLFVGATMWTDYYLHGGGAMPHSQYKAQTSMNDYKHIRTEPDYRKISPRYTSELFAKHTKKIAAALQSEEYNKSVVVSHHAPSEMSIHEDYKGQLLSPAYASNLESFMDEHKPDIWIHGHVHNSFDYNIYNTRVLCNPRGYVAAGEPNLDFAHTSVIEI